MFNIFPEPEPGEVGPVRRRKKETADIECGSCTNRGKGMKQASSDAVIPAGFERPMPPTLAASGNSPCPAFPP